MDIIPHGVDQTIFKPLANKAELREKYFNYKDNTFLIGCVARNQPRKRLDAIFQVLAILKKKYELKNRPIKCHFHCAIEDKMGNNLLWLAKYYDVVEMCVFDNRLKPGFGVHPQMLNEIFNCYDSHLLLTNSEGWGLPIIETMAAGIPNVISNYSAHADWSKDAALKVKLVAKVHEIKTDHIKGIVDIEHAAKQISLLYQSDKMCKDYSNRSVSLATKLNWDNIGPDWIKLFDEFDTSDLKDGRYDIIKKDFSDFPAIPEDPINTPFKLMEL
jgi:glycosyltransferase involved in cell wall biosynthesis